MWKERVKERLSGDFFSLGTVFMLLLSSGHPAGREQLYADVSHIDCSTCVPQILLEQAETKIVQLGLIQ